MDEPQAQKQVVPSKVAHQKIFHKPGQWIMKMHPGLRQSLTFKLVALDNVSKTFHIIPSSKSCEYVLNTLMQFLMLKDNEAKVLNVSDAIEENNAFDATSSHLTELEANEVVNDGDMELLTDVESTSRIDARDQASELVLVDGKQDGAEVVGVADDQNSNEPDVLENNGVIGVEVNENNEGSKGILEDVPEVNKKESSCNIENSEIGVSSDADLKKQ
ncbi:hypothetical protein Tco_0394065 [Tanacetum coccineum]